MFCTSPASYYGKAASFPMRMTFSRRLLIVNANLATAFDTVIADVAHDFHEFSFSKISININRSFIPQTSRDNRWTFVIKG